MKPKESDIQKAILAWLKMQVGVYAFRTNNIGVPLPNGKFRPSPIKGLSDIICVWRGRFMAIEVKRPGGKISTNQANFLERVRKAGGFAFVVFSLEELIEQVKQIDDPLKY